MGGTLALWVGEQHPDVTALVSINTSSIRHPLEKVMLLIGRFGVPRWVKAIGNDSMEEPVDERAYVRLPLRSTYQLALLSPGRSARTSARSPARPCSSPRRWTTSSPGQPARDLRLHRVTGQDVGETGRLLPPGHHGPRQRTGLCGRPGVHSGSQRHHPAFTVGEGTHIFAPAEQRGSGATPRPGGWPRRAGWPSVRPGT